ncbi:hypothetical protein K439DRAFT_1618601 [Ramaria rubella]|nr:hypothetical protein K439DRAFT_1618601 [Ramaria rubella]
MTQNTNNLQESTRDVSSNGQEGTSESERFADHSSSPPDFHSPTSPASEHHSSLPPDFHSPTSRITGIQEACNLSSAFNDLLIGYNTGPSSELHNTGGSDDRRPTTILLGVKRNAVPSSYAVLTGFSKEQSTVDDLISAIIGNPETQYVLEKLLELFSAGDGCQVLDKLSTILTRMLSNHDERGITVYSAMAPQTRVPSVTLWGFPETDLLYILYLIPEAPSLEATPLGGRGLCPHNIPLHAIEGCVALSHPSSTPDSFIQDGTVHMNATQWLKNHFPSIHTLSGALIRQRSFGRPYRTHLHIQMALYVAKQLGSTTIVDGFTISSLDIKRFVTRLQPATFDNNRSHLNKYCRVFAMVTSDSDETYVHNIKVKKFKRLCQELFVINEDTITTVSVAVGSEVEFKHSVWSKAWGYMNRLREEVKICLSEASSFSENDSDKQETSM